MVPIGILGQVWYLIVLIPDLCTLTLMRFWYLYSFLSSCMHGYLVGQEELFFIHVPTLGMGAVKSLVRWYAGAALSKILLLVHAIHTRIS